MFNIACGQRTSLNDLYYKICDLLGKQIEPRYEPPRQGDVKHSLADITKAKTVLGYQAKYDVFTGLEMAIDWYREHAQLWM